MLGAPVPAALLLGVSEYQFSSGIRRLVPELRFSQSGFLRTHETAPRVGENRPAICWQRRVVAAPLGRGASRHGGKSAVVT